MGFGKRWFLSNEEIVGLALEVGHDESHSQSPTTLQMFFFSVLFNDNLNRSTVTNCVS